MIRIRIDRPQLRLLTVAAAVMLVCRCSVAAEDKPSLKATARRDDDRIVIEQRDGAAILSIKSPFGISGVSIERLADNWPESIVVRLRLKGLENFRVASGQLTLGAAAALKDDKPAIREWLGDGKETPLDEKSRYWIDLRILKSDGKPATDRMPEDGYFEIRLPKTIFVDNPKSIRLEWIDFYR